MESRKKRLGPLKFGVRYENQRASLQSERTPASWFLIWVDTLDYHEIQAFSWRLLSEYLFKLLTCRLSNSYDVNLAKNCLDSWMKNHPNGQTQLASRLLVIPHWKHGCEDAVVMVTCHFFLILIGSEKIREILIFTPQSDKNSIHKLLTRFLRRDVYLNLFL